VADVEKIYHHGTDDRLAYAIMTQGFKLGETRHGRRLGRGLYITQRLKSAVFWSHQIVIRCKMLPGTRLLWINEGYDRKIIRQLRREFGKEIVELGPQFERAIPHNKQLTKNELIALCNYHFENRSKKLRQYGFKKKKGKGAQYWNAWLRLSRLHEHVRRHGYDGLGDRSFQEWDSDEILMFNPSRMTPISAHWFYADEEYENVSISPALELDELKTISSKAQEEYLRELEGEADAELDNSQA
jgi:hypothetical protein